MSLEKTASGRRLLTPAFLAVTFLSCLMTACLQMTVSAMPLFVAELGVSKALAGSATTACTLASLCFRPLSARLADGFGARRTALMGAGIYVLVFCAYFLCGNLSLMLTLRALQGVGMSMLTTALGTVATALVPPGQITRGMGYFSLGNAVALSLGPALGLWLTERFGFGGLFFFGAAASTLAAVLLVILRRGGEPGEETSAPRAPRAFRRGFLKNALACGALAPSAVLAVLILCQTSLSTYLSFFAESLRLGSAAPFFTLNVVGMVLSKFFLGGLCDRLGPRPVALGSGALEFAAFLLVASAGTAGQTGIWLAGLLYGFGYGGLYTLLNVAAVERASPENRGTANALFFGAKDVGTSVGSLAWGAVSLLGYPAVFLLAALLAASAAGWLALRRRGNSGGAF